MGIHTGDSIVVAPTQTLSNHEYQLLRSASIRVIRSIGIVGECNIQYAVHPETEEYKVIEVNSRLSRSSALASKATGYPIAYATAKIAIGYNLDEIKNPKTGESIGNREPIIDYTVVKMPRWDFQKFKKVDRKLGTQMKSVGEVMAIGKTFEEAIQKAVRMMDQDRELTDMKSDLTLEEIKDEIENPTDQRLFSIIEAIRRGVSVNEIHQLSGITHVFLESLKKIVEFENVLKTEEISIEKIEQAKKFGFSDEIITSYSGKSWQEYGRLESQQEFYQRSTGS